MKVKVLMKSNIQVFQKNYFASMIIFVEDLQHIAFDFSKFF